MWLSIGDRDVLVHDFQTTVVLADKYVRDTRILQVLFRSARAEDAQGLYLLSLELHGVNGHRRIRPYDLNLYVAHIHSHLAATHHVFTTAADQHQPARLRAPGRGGKNHGIFRITILLAVGLLRSGDTPVSPNRGLDF